MGKDRIPGWFCDSVQPHPEVAPGGGIGPGLLVLLLDVQHPADDLVGQQEAPGR